MKKIRILLIFLVFTVVNCSLLTAQDPPPPPEGGHGQTGNSPPGGGAPVGEGLVFLLALAATRLGWKFLKKKEE